MTAIALGSVSSEDLGTSGKSAARACNVFFGHDEAYVEIDENATQPDYSRENSL